MVRLLAKSDLASSLSLRTAAPAVQALLHASNIVRSKLACSGCLTKIILRSDELRSIPISVSAARNAPARDQMERFLMAVHGTLLRWFRPMTGKPSTVSCFQTYHLHRRQVKPGFLTYLDVSIHHRLYAGGDSVFKYTKAHETRSSVARPAVTVHGCE